MILGYRLDLKEKELEEVVKIIFVIWEFFKNVKQVNRIKISEKKFEKIQQRNFHMLKYFEGEKEEQYNFVKSDLKHLKSKALLTGVFFQFNHKKALIDMKNEEKSLLLVSMKRLIECFDDITGKNRINLWR